MTSKNTQTIIRCSVRAFIFLRLLYIGIFLVFMSLVHIRPMTLLWLSFDSALLYCSIKKNIGLEITFAVLLRLGEYQLPTIGFIY